MATRCLVWRTRPKELEKRRLIRELVVDLVKLDRVVSQLRMKILRRKFHQTRHGSLGSGQSALPPFVSRRFECTTDDVVSGSPSNMDDATEEAIPRDVANNPNNGEGCYSEYITSSPRTFVASPELVASEQYVLALP